MKMAWCGATKSIGICEMLMQTWQIRNPHRVRGVQPGRATILSQRRNCSLCRYRVIPLLANRRVVAACITKSRTLKAESLSLLPTTRKHHILGPSHPTHCTSLRQFDIGLKCAATTAAAAAPALYHYRYHYRYHYHYHYHHYHYHYHYHYYDDNDDDCYRYRYCTVY